MDSASDSMKAFERMEEKADRMLDEANSMAELNSDEEDPIEDLEAKYAGKDASVDEELEKLKKGNGTIKTYSYSIGFFVSLFITNIKQIVITTPFKILDKEIDHQIPFKLMPLLIKSLPMESLQLLMLQK